jgi:hypothetical protein
MKAACATETVMALPFTVGSVSRTAAPKGAEGLWHSYVISQGANTIAGVRAGTQTEVTMQLNLMVERLNERRMGRTRPRSKAR